MWEYLDIYLLSCSLQIIVLRYDYTSEILFIWTDDTAGATAPNPWG